MLSFILSQLVIGAASEQLEEAASAATAATTEEGYSFVELFVYALLGGMIVYLLKQIFFPPPQPPRPVYVPKPKPVPRPFTLEELRKYDGTDNQPIYVGVKGRSLECLLVPPFLIVNI